jgi:hypothetical protein
VRRLSDGRPCLAPRLPFIILLFLLVGICNTEGSKAEDNRKVLRVETFGCNGTTSCVEQPQLGQVITSSDQVFQDRNDQEVTPQGATGFDPNEACPTTELSNTGIDARSVENQVGVQNARIWG